jgi:hypothetical protein
MGKNFNGQFWSEHKRLAEQRMEAYDRLDPDLRQFVWETNDLVAASGQQDRRRFFARSEAPVEGRIERKSRKGFR